MPSSPDTAKTRLHFWLAFAALYIFLFAAITFTARAFHVPSAFLSGLGTLLMGISFVLITLLFRKKGTPTVKQSIQILEKKAILPTDGAQNEYELHMNRRSWRGLSACFAAFMLSIVYLAFEHPPKPHEWIYVINLFSLFAAIALLFAAFGWLRPSLIARIDEQGITMVKGWSKHTLIPWSKIKSCQQTQTDLFATNSQGLLWQFKDERGKILLQMAPFDVPEDQKQQFAQVLTRYMTPSEPTIKKAEL